MKDRINREANKIRELYEKVRSTYAHRDTDGLAYLEWQKVCEKFHCYRSSIDEYFERDALARLAEGSPSHVEFAITFLELDPWFFRSGYIKEDFIHRLKRVDLDDMQRKRVLRILVDAVMSRGTREYKRYCRLAIVFATEHLVSELFSIRRLGEPGQRSRAKLMLQYIVRHVSLET